MSAGSSTPISPDTPPTPAVAADGSDGGAPCGEAVVLLGGVRKFTLAAGDPAQRVLPFSRVTIKYSLAVVQPSDVKPKRKRRGETGGVDVSSGTDDDEDDDEEGGGSILAESASEMGSPAPIRTPTSSMFKSATAFANEGQVIESVPSVSLIVGEGENQTPLVTGLEAALLTMFVGEQARVVIPSVKGFEGHHVHEKISGDVLLVYDVHVKSADHKIDVLSVGGCHITKYVTSAGAAPLPGPICYEALVRCKWIEAHPVTDKLMPPQILDVTVGISHEQTVDAVLMSMQALNELSEFLVRSPLKPQRRFLVSLQEVSLPPPPRTFAHRAAITEAMQRKQRGNEQFKARELTKAVQSYLHGAQFLHLDAFPGPEGSLLAGERDDLRAVLYGNAAQVCLDAKWLQDAVAYSTSAIELNPTNPKFHFRRSKALRLLGQVRDARADLTKAESLIGDGCGSPIDDKAIRGEFEELARLEEQQQHDALASAV